MPSSNTILRLPYNFAVNHGICVNTGGESPQIFYKPGLYPHILAEVFRFAGETLPMEKVSSEVFEKILSETYQQKNGAAQKFADDADSALSLNHAVESVQRNEDLLAQEENAPIIQLINALLLEALREHASDIHIETFEKMLSVRLRIDGVLKETLNLRPSIAPSLVSRIKVMAHLDIAEKRLPQDGRISIRVGSHELDVRVSTLASGSGERVVLRLLDKQAQRLDLTHLGMDAISVEIVTGLSQKPHGIILITGPTGSGKTTTLYAILTRLNDRTRNIMTIEDPVEYQIQGIGQTQVNTRAELTFARGLRAILRQDPDIVMVGEIRDTETAGIAIQASLTGHLVLSTLHTNTALGAITRLMDMGMEPFLLSSSLAGVMAQRLVRVLCNHCKQPYSPREQECAFLGISFTEAPKLYRAVGCDACRSTGYSGRLGIYEVVAVDDTLRVMIHEKASEHDLEAYARTRSPGIRENGRNKILSGITTTEEVMRVTSE